MNKQKVVVIGGGTGTFNILQGLKKLPLDITAIVTMADSGGSSGRLRDEFGVLPPGDVRQCLAALADNGDTDLLRELFLYRFDKGTGLVGHNFGNLLLTALTDIVGSEALAIEYASKLLRIHGKVLPVTVDEATLCCEYEDGFIVKGEHKIDEPHHNGFIRIKKAWLEPEVKITDDVRLAMENADIVVLGPGDLYTSIIANLLVSGMESALKKKKLIYVSNLISKYGQSYKYNLSDHVNDLEKFLNRRLDFILVNNEALPKGILRKYKSEEGYAVENDMKNDSRVISSPMLAGEIIKTKSGDTLRRSMIRHDSDKLAEEVYKLVSGSNPLTTSRF